jgi:hypothetical protein
MNNWDRGYESVPSPLVDTFRYRLDDVDITSLTSGKTCLYQLSYNLKTIFDAIECTTSTHINFFYSFNLT